MKVSVVILNWNGKALMEDLLDNVIENTLNENDKSIEIVVADNGSSDGSLDFLRNRYSDKIRVIDLEKNHGFAEGYNLALSKVESTYVVLLNSDVEVTPGWLSSLTRFMDENTDVAACQPKIRSLRQRDRFEHAGAAGGFIDILGYPFCRGRILTWLEEDAGQYDERADIFWATGACLFIRLDDYKAAGGLDSRFFAHMEEIDLCWRLRSRGKRIVCLPESCVFHLGGATLSKENPRKTYLNYRNNLLMLYKNHTSGSFIIIFLIRLLLDYFSAFIFVGSGKFGDAKAVFMARKDFWKMLPDFRAQRLMNKKSTVISDISQIYRGSIIVECYLFGKRKFVDFFRE